MVTALSREVELLRRGNPRLYGEFNFGVCGDESPRKPTAARQYKKAATSRRAFIPKISDRFSSRPPTTAPSMLAPRAAAGDSAARNSEANNNPAKKTGMAKMSAAQHPTTAAEPGIRLKGTK